MESIHKPVEDLACDPQLSVNYPPPIPIDISEPSLTTRMQNIYSVRSGSHLPIWVRSASVRPESSVSCGLSWSGRYPHLPPEQAKSSVVLLPKTKREWKWRVCIYSDKWDILRGATHQRDQECKVPFKFYIRIPLTDNVFHRRELRVHVFIPILPVQRGWCKGFSENTMYTILFLQPSMPWLINNMIRSAAIQQCQSQAYSILPREFACSFLLPVYLLCVMRSVKWPRAGYDAPTMPPDQWWSYIHCSG